MKQRFTSLLYVLVLGFPMLLLGQHQTATTTLSAPTTSSIMSPTVGFTTTNVTCFGAADGCATAVATGSAANQLGYLWSTGETTATICNLAAGNYFVTVTDTVPGGSPIPFTIYEEDFDGANNWTLSNLTGTNAVEANVWQINDEEGGVAPTGCGVANNGDSTLHITCTSLLCGSLITGAVYNATQESNIRAESPVFSTVGFVNSVLAFEFIANGDGLLDNASLVYNAGAGWVVLDASLKSTICVTGQGEWTAYSVTLPPVCDNNPTVQIGFNWTNNNDNLGTDPSVAINNIEVRNTTSTGQIDVVVANTTISQPLALLVSSIDSIAGAICAGDSNGLVNLAVSGGTLPYSFLWSNGAVSQNIAGLPDDLYTVTVTDASGCTALDTALVPLLGRITATIDSTVNILCNGDSTGAIFASAIGDTALNNCSSSVVRLNEFLYRPMAAMNNGTDPNTGEYIELIGPPGTDLSCYILTDGDWTITLPAGTTIPSDGFFTIGNDFIWGAGTFDLDAENCNCFTDGGGGAGLLILTDGGETIAMFDATGTFVDGVIYGNPSAGNQPFGSTITTVGLGGCLGAVTFPAATAYSTAPGGVLAGTALVRDPDGSGSWVAQVGGSLNACNNVNATGTGGAIAYLWSNGDTTQNISGIPAGTYTVTATNALGCTDTASFTLIEPAALSVMDSLTNIACMGDSTGSINLTVTGGAAPYTFAWDNGATTEDLDSLPAGVYCGTVTDSNGCTAALCATLLEDSLNIPVDTLYLCPGDSVQLQVNTTLTSVVWTPSATLSNDTILNPFASPATTTTYVVQGRTSSSSSCTMLDSVVVVVQPIDLTTTMITNVACFGDSTGSIATNLIGGPYTYLWSTGDTTAAIDSLPTGAYSVVVTNATGCSDSATYIVIQPAAAIGATAVVTDANCTDSTGSIALTVTGGTTPYSFAWSNGDSTATIDSLTAGFYCGTITDDNGCTAVLCDSVAGGSVTLDIPVDTLFICAGDSIALQANTTATSIQWTPATDLSNDTITNPMASPSVTTTYTVTTLGTCVLSDSVVVIVGASNFNIALAMTAEPNCFGDSTGSIMTSTTSTNVSYLWNTGDTTANLNNVPAGTYTLVATDSSSCEDTLTIGLTQPDSLQVSLGAVTPVTCRSGNDGAIASATVTGGTPSYTYLWSNTATTDSVDNLSAGLYFLSVTDANGCVVVGFATVDEPLDSISISYTATPVSCNGIDDGSITAQPINGTPAYTYQWGAAANNQTTATATQLSTGTYVVTVTDANGCTATAIGVFVPKNVAIDTNAVTIVAIDSFLDCDLSPTGVLAVSTINNYTYLWSNGETAQQANGLAAGSYSVTVSNSQNCSIILYDTIDAPFVPTITPYIDVFGNVSSTGTAGEVFDIGAGNDESSLGVQYSWTGSATNVVIVDPSGVNTTVSATTSGTYTLLLTATANDANACQDTGSVVLIIESVFLGMPTAFTPNGDGINDLYRPIGLTAEDVLRFKIYNRWGQIVYEGDNLENDGWDGTFQGSEQPTEEYVFVLEYQIGNNAPRASRGGFTLVR